MELLSNEVLLEAYFKAIALDLGTDFIVLLQDEISRRDLKYAI
ncbi:developmental checkpoint coupling sporulation initiation to replication initiation [Aneurinibacillus soli]|uniref:Sporulation inhibitor sda n=1 Tax=Aneurinibacillus soli TaxID=1500254 RepID=A0A0U5AV79_9BACL|nr:sporulation histidine kinase inhibitor Sda [Aneurinibacillus soli]PYE63415.1 developmental checkpoint coupling sporulation initiation to replication initiation [Aneurinibacillus soli]BAU27653.1 Sporulation inhibitor sda [Aneurinibacillus soli]